MKRCEIGNLHHQPEFEYQTTLVLNGVWAFFWRVLSPQNRGHSHGTKPNEKPRDPSTAPSHSRSQCNECPNLLPLAVPGTDVGTKTKGVLGLVPKMTKEERFGDVFVDLHVYIYIYTHRIHVWYIYLQLA